MKKSYGQWVPSLLVKDKIILRRQSIPYTTVFNCGVAPLRLSPNTYLQICILGCNDFNNLLVRNQNWKIYQIISIWVSKNAEFDADFESVEKVVKKFL
jgi:hypothetical protein